MSRSRLPGGRRLWLGLPLLLSSLLLLAAWNLTEPLERPTRATPISAILAQDPTEPEPLEAAEPEWPDDPLEGILAKRLLLRTLRAAERRLEGVDDYTATFRKRERIDGRLGDEHVMRMKVRHQPFAVYLKFLDPEPGKEIVYAEGHYDNQMIAHAGGLARLLVPRLAVAPDHPMAMANNRHPITEAGLARLTRKLVAYRRMDLDDPDAQTRLDRVEGPDGRPWLRSTHTHPSPKAERPFARVEVLYDPETWLPVQISSYDWPGPDHSGDLLLAEQYAYHDLDLEVDLGPLDFDPANPDYAFHRF